MTHSRVAFIPFVMENSRQLGYLSFPQVADKRYVIDLFKWGNLSTNAKVQLRHTGERNTYGLQ